MPVVFDYNAFILLSMNEDIVFFREDGTPAENVVLTNYDKKTGEYVFFELLGITGQAASINGKKKYKRLLIQRVFPYQLVNNDENVE